MVNNKKKSKTFELFIPIKKFPIKMYREIGKEIKLKYEKDLWAMKHGEKIVDIILTSLTDSTFVVRLFKSLTQINLINIAGSFVMPSLNYVLVHFITNDVLDDSEVYKLKNKCKRNGIDLYVRY